MNRVLTGKNSITFLTIIFLFQQMLVQSGCAHIIPPEGGLKDTLPPIPMKSSPKDSILNFKGNKITIDFNEYIQLDNAYENVLISPYPSRQATVESRLKTLTVKLKDSLLPNTTYTIDFGKAIKDVNEGNVLKGFQFVFSTGSTIDSGTLTGKVLMAETGKADSTLIVTLYRKLDDSAVYKQKPFYIARVKGDGSFRFSNLPKGTFAVYALKDANGNKQYDQKSEVFAFLDQPVTISDSVKPVMLYAFAEEEDFRPVAKTATTVAKTAKKFTVATNLENSRQSLLDPLELTFSAPLKNFDPAKISFLDSSKQTITDYQWIQDSTNKKFSLQYKWQPGMSYTIVAMKDFATDTSGNQLAKNDTINFTAKKESEYGSLRLKFNNLDKSRNPVLQFVKQDKIVKTVVVNDEVWSEKLMDPGEYEIRVLLDENKNGKWDPGSFFGQHKQPERILPLNIKITIKPNWENENTIDLKE